MVNIAINATIPKIIPANQTPDFYHQNTPPEQVLYLASHITDPQSAGYESV
jgi:hypothetical protein